MSPVRDTLLASFRHPLQPPSCLTPRLVDPCAVNTLVIIMCYTKVPLCIYPIAAGVDELIPTPTRAKSFDGSSPSRGGDPEHATHASGGGMAVKIGVLAVFALTKAMCPSITVVLGYAGACCRVGRTR